MIRFKLTTLLLVLLLGGNIDSACATPDSRPEVLESITDCFDEAATRRCLSNPELTECGKPWTARPYSVCDGGTVSLMRERGRAAYETLRSLRAARDLETKKHDYNSALFLYLDGYERESIAGINVNKEACADGIDRICSMPLPVSHSNFDRLILLGFEKDALQAGKNTANYFLNKKDFNEGDIRRLSALQTVGLTDEHRIMQLLEKTRQKCRQRWNSNRNNASWALIARAGIEEKSRVERSSLLVKESVLQPMPFFDQPDSFKEGRSPKMVPMPILQRSSENRESMFGF